MTLPNGNPYPDITICNYNRVKDSAAKRLNISDDLLAYFYLAMRGSYPVHIKGDNINVKRIQKIILYSLKKYNIKFSFFKIKKPKQLFRHSHPAC